MGMDPSFHPVDVALIQNRIFPYILGQGEIDDLIEQAVRLTRVRFRANAWGLALVNARNHDRFPVPPTFDSHLHVWGRPFFITVPSPQDVCDAVDRYLACRPEEVDRLAREMLAVLDVRLVDLVQPDASVTLPDDATLARGLRAEMDFFRDAYRAYRSGETITTADEEDVAPAELFAARFPLAVIEFAANFRPGWMARGYVWPTYFFSEANIDAEDFSGTCEELFEPLLSGIPEIRQNLEPTITENYMVGSYVPADIVPAFADFFAAHRPLLIERFHQEYGWDEAGSPDLVKIAEALAYARHHGLAFAEATEVYSGIMGIMN